MNCPLTRVIIQDDPLVDWLHCPPMKGSWGTAFLAAALALSTLRAEAQDSVSVRAGRRQRMRVDSEVALARSAAPSSVSDPATVLVLADSGYVVARSGTNAVTCLVNRSWLHSLEPQCYDAEATSLVNNFVELATVVFGGSTGVRSQPNMRARRGEPAVHQISVRRGRRSSTWSERGSCETAIPGSSELPGRAGAMLFQLSVFEERAC